jgi:hypothetical protein
MGIRHNGSSNPYLKVGGTGLTNGTRVAVADLPSPDGVARGWAWERAADGTTSVLLPETDCLAAENRNHSLWIKPIGATSPVATLFMQSYAGATFVSGHGSGVTYPLATGVWTRIDRSQVTASLAAGDTADATRMRTLVRCSGGGTFQVALFLWEGAASLAEAGTPPGAYFDGDTGTAYGSPGAAWDAGTDGTSTLTLPDGPVQVGTAVANGGQNTAVSLAAPSGTATGDHQGVVLHVATTGETMPAPAAGWLLRGSLSMTGGQAGGTDTTQTLFYTADPTADPAAAAFTLTKPGSRLWRGCRFTFRGGPGWNLASLTIGTSPLGTSHAVPAQTTTVADSVVIGGVALDPGTATTATVTEPAGWTELSDTTQATATGTLEALTVAVASIVKATPGAVTGSFTPSISDDAMVWSIVLPSAAAPASTIARTRGFLSILLGG